MEHVEGVQLAQVWSMMTGDQRIRCIGTIFQHLKQVANMTFPAYGSLYYANIPLESSCKIPLDQDYCIGPHCGAMYWGCRPSEPRYYQNVGSHHGPCKYVTVCPQPSLIGFQGLISKHTATASSIRASPEFLQILICQHTHGIKVLRQNILLSSSPDEP